MISAQTKTIYLIEHEITVCAVQSFESGKLKLFSCFGNRAIDFDNWWDEQKKILWNYFMKSENSFGLIKIAKLLFRGNN